ncbi:hypothetical protein F4054_16125 [Candidatus Poribacteria bacterium]|nr:hypothetical protein [Candidatus Poribacteria bacterium]MYG05450.1 hypothetical protein [Candidatus Poribacteria bacterium]MYK23770.1 hypothetical protein [Candidatus Poribacteria bacterium]
MEHGQMWLRQQKVLLRIYLMVIPALISSYQEARGTVKGTAKEGEVWTKWYQRQTEAKAQGYTLTEVPPSLHAD